MGIAKNRWVSQSAVLSGLLFAGVLGGLLLSRTFGRELADFRKSFGSQSIIRQYLRTHSNRKLQIGAGGNNLPGWLNTDIEPSAGQAYLDATKRFPMPERSFSYIFSEHVIEHLTRDDAIGMLKECYRVLAPGGKIRIATPNILTFIQLFRQEKTPEMRRYVKGKIEWHGWPRTTAPECLLLNYQLRSFGHQFLYDPSTLRESLALAGFQIITESSPGVSNNSELKGLEARHDSRVRELNDYETMVLEAIRP